MKIPARKRTFDNAVNWASEKKAEGKVHSWEVKLSLSLLTSFLSFKAIHGHCVRCAGLGYPPPLQLGTVQGPLCPAPLLQEPPLSVVLKKHVGGGSQRPDSELALWFWGGSMTRETEFLAVAACLWHFQLLQYSLHPHAAPRKPARPRVEGGWIELKRFLAQAGLSVPGPVLALPGYQSLEGSVAIFQSSDPPNLSLTQTGPHFPILRSLKCQAPWGPPWPPQPRCCSRWSFLPCGQAKGPWGTCPSHSAFGSLRCPSRTFSSSCQPSLGPTALASAPACPDPHSSVGAPRGQGLGVSLTTAWHAR